MKDSIYNLEFRVKTGRVNTERALIELENAVRQADRALDTYVLCSAEILADYQTYEKLRQAACLVRDAMNELWEANGGHSRSEVHVLED